MTYQQCLTCTRCNIPPEQVSCPACGSVNLRGYDPAASDAPGWHLVSGSDPEVVVKTTPRHLMFDTVGP